MPDSELDELSNDLIEEEISIDDFDIGDITNTTEDLDDSLGDDIFSEEEEFVDNLDDEEF